MKVFNQKLKNLEGITYVKNHGLSTKRTKNYLNCFHALPPGNKMVFISFSVLLHFFSQIYTINDANPAQYSANID